MDYINKMDETLSIFPKLKYPDIYEKLYVARNYSTTSTELLLSFTFELKEAIKNYPELNMELGRVLQDLVSFCISIGLIIDNLH